MGGKEGTRRRAEGRRERGMDEEEIRARDVEEGWRAR